MLADKAGVLIEIGNMRKNFYWNKEIPVYEDERSLALGEQLPKRYYIWILADLKYKNDQRFNKVHVACIIELDKYQRLLE